MRPSQVGRDGTLAQGDTVQGEMHLPLGQNTASREQCSVGTGWEGSPVSSAAAPGRQTGGVATRLSALTAAARARQPGQSASCCPCPLRSQWPS